MKLLRHIAKDVLWRVSVATTRTLFVPATRVSCVCYQEPPHHCGFILAANHISHFDPALLTVHFPRRIDWIAMSDLFRRRGTRAFFSGLNAIPVERSGMDRTALRAALRRLEEGRVVGIFPEGGIRDGRASIVNGAPMKQGASMLCAVSDSPIVPCVILGSDRLYNAKNWLPWRRAPIWIGVGKAIHSPRGLGGEARRERVQRELSDAFVGLRDELRRDFELSDADMPRPPGLRMRER